MRQIFYYSCLLLISCGSPSDQAAKATKKLPTEPTSLNVNSLNTEQHAFVDAVQVEQKSEELANEPQELSSEVTDTLKCSSQIISVTHRKMAELTRADINLFLRSFSKSCRNNAEFSEWSNELLHQILSAYPKNLVLQLSEQQEYDLDFILKEFETPVNDKYMPQELILKVNELGISNQTTEAVIAALKVAQSKY